MNLIKKAYCLLLVLLYSTILQAQDSRWDVNIYDYQYDMSVYAELQYNGSVITDFTNIEVAAFVGNECRAVGVPQQKDGVRWIYFRVRSNTVAGENVVFKMYDKTEDKEYYLASNGNIEFEANKSLGFPSSPITLVKTVLYSVSASSANESMGSATVENYVGEAPENSNVIVKATPAIGHSFVEWSNNGTIVSTDNPYTFKITEDTHLLAHFKINQYTITFDTDGGSEIAPITQDYNTAITAPVDPTKTGYTFAGWDKEIPATMPAEDITIKALWTINSYKLTYKVDGDVYKQYDVEYNSAITPEAAPEKEGYTFSGWSEIPTTMPANDVEVTGTFTVNQYKVTFIVDGEVVKEETLDFGTAITVPENPTKVGHTFTGWNPAVDTTVPSHDVTYTAQFTVNQYTITFDTDGGSEITPITQDYNTAVTAPSDPTKTGYTFAGWDKEIPTTMPAENITIKALWTINKYMLTYKVDGEVYKQYEIEYNAAITPETAPTKEGYSFSGWSEIPATMPANDVEVSGTFTINQYKVSFVVDGIAVKEEMLDFGSAITAPVDPTKIGHTFTGWNPAVDATVPAHDVTYVAQFTINQYTITFDTDGGSEIAPITQDYNTAITAPANPTKTGYTFAGWDKEIPAMMPAENITIKALWTINKYKLSYLVDGEIYKQYEIEYNSAITPETAPTKEGYTFSGWSEIPAVMPAHDVEVNGSFTVNKYKVTFISDGAVIKEDSLAFGSSITVPEDPTKVGYTFTGWNPAVDATVPAHDVIYTAQFTINQYTITFDTDGGSEIAPITQDYNTAISAPANPTRTGYTFAGWDKEIPATMPAENITIKALWTINKYLLTYKVDGEVYKQYEIEYNSAITPETAPTKEGYSFSGWSEIPATMPANDVEVNGTFTINQYKVSFVVDGVTIQEETLDFGSAITAPEDPTKIGHTFTGWNPAVDATVPAHDVTYTAQFTINQYTITFDTDGGSEIAPITQDYNTAISAPANPTKTGYTFARWDREIPATMPAENITIKALWTINKYKLSYLVDGEIYKQYEIEYNSAITPETAPTKEGYTFSGWSEIPAVMPAHDVEVNGSFTVNKYLLTYMVDGVVYHTDSVAYGTEIVLIDEPVREGKTFSGWKGAPETMPARDVIIMGSFDANVYTLTYKVDGEIYKSVQYPYGAEIIPEAEPTKEGYTFSGWSEIPSTMPAHDVEVNGSFTVNKYKVTFISDGTVIKEDTLAFGSPITAPANPTKVGHSFIGWNPAVDATVPAHDVTYTAQFTINQYTITFDTDGGSEIAPITQDYNTAISAPANPTKTGYTFAGWDKEIPATMPAENITIKALWTINKYLLTYKVDGEVYKQYEIEYNSAITPETAPTKEGYTFSGWSEIPAVMPAHDVEVNGSFTVNKYLLTYMVDGVVYHTDSVAYGTEIVLIDEPVREGKTFSGWKGAPETMPARDVIIMGSFDANVYTLTYKVDGEIYKSVQYPYGAEIIPEAEPTKEGYTFSGWSEIPATMPAHDVEVTGTFAVNYYLLTYFVDGEVYMTDSIAYGMEIVPSEEPTKEGYTFSGWSEIPATMPAHDVEVTGSFSANTYYIIYKVEGEEYFVDSVKYGEQIVPVEEPEREGHTFSGWQGLPEDLLMPAHDVEVTGTFVVNYYLLTYLVDGDVYQQDSVAYGTEIVLMPNPEKPGYIFSGWSGYPEDLLMPAADVTIVGSFEVDGIQRVAAGAGTEDTMYDVLGRKVQNPRKGEIYLQNGKKIMIR